MYKVNHESQKHDATIFRSILYNMVDRLADGLVSAFQSLVQKSRDKKRKSADHMPMTQARALQLLFDIRFITGVLPKREESDTSHKVKLVTR